MAQYSEWVRTPSSRYGLTMLTTHESWSNSRLCLAISRMSMNGVWKPTARISSIIASGVSATSRDWFVAALFTSTVGCQVRITSSAVASPSGVARSA